MTSSRTPSKIEMGKTYRTRDGWEVRIYATDGAGSDAVHGAVRSGGEWCQYAWWADGKWMPSQGATGADLIEVRPRIERDVWINVYEDHAKSWPTRNSADTFGTGRVACVKVSIDVEHGHGFHGDPS